MNRKRLLLAALLPVFQLSAQSPEMADHLRSEGKFYVVIAVILIIFICLAVYMVMIDRKLTKIEKEIRGMEGPLRTQTEPHEPVH